MAEIRKSGEDYLEAILMLKRQKGVVHSVDVAHHLEFSKPSVSRAMGILRDEGYLEMAENGELTLTKEGQQRAERIYERHEVLTAMLLNLGVPHEVAAADACLMEHAISDESFGYLKAHYYAMRDKPGPGEDKDDKKKKKKKKKG